MEWKNKQSEWLNAGWLWFNDLLMFVLRFTWKKNKKTKTKKTQITTDSTRTGVRLFDFKKVEVTVGYFEKNDAYLEAGWGR